MNKDKMALRGGALAVWVGIAAGLAALACTGAAAVLLFRWLTPLQLLILAALLLGNALLWGLFRWVKPAGDAWFAATSPDESAPS